MSGKRGEDWERKLRISELFADMERKRLGYERLEVSLQRRGASTKELRTSMGWSIFNDFFDQETCFRLAEMSDEELEWWVDRVLGERIERIKEERKRWESLVRARKRLPYEMAVIFLVLSYITFLKEEPPDILIGLLLLSLGLWIWTAYNAARKREEPLVIEGLVDLFLFPGQFVILGIMLVVSWRNSGFWSAFRDTFVILAIAYMGTPILIVLIFTGLWKIVLALIFDNLEGSD